jgi:hypothetical protein
VINIEEYRRGRYGSPRAGRRRLQRLPQRLALSASADLVLNRNKIPGPNQWIPLLNAPAETDSKLSFSGDRVGRSEMAPLLKICVTKDAVLEADSDRETDPANCFNLWSELAILELQRMHRAAMELLNSRRRGAIADCVYRSNSIASRANTSSFPVAGLAPYLGNAQISRQTEKGSRAADARQGRSS